MTFNGVDIVALNLSIILLLGLIFGLQFVLHLNGTSRTAGYAEAGTYCEFRDAGMSAAWNASGTCFAAASQDGKVCVWDPRGKKVGGLGLLDKGTSLYY